LAEPRGPATPRADIIGRLRSAGCAFAEEEAALLVAAAPTPAELAVLVGRRTSGLPLEHVLGRAEFCGLQIAVGAGVFVPRRRTELLAHEATILARAASEGQDRPPAVVVELCCGSGAVSAAISAALPDVTVYAADLDPTEVAYARRNVAPGTVVLEGDLFEPLPAVLRGRIDVLVANAPYVPTEAIATMPPEARIHEALVALDGGPDGLDVVRRVINEAPQWLAQGGHVLVEASDAQEPLVVEAVERAGMVPRVARSEELGATVVVGTLHAVECGSVS
jgi:release factor glutamine methyltransferase